MNIKKKVLNHTKTSKNLPKNKKSILRYLYRSTDSQGGKKHRRLKIWTQA